MKTKDPVDRRVADNAAIVHEVLRRRKAITSIELSGELLMRHKIEVSGRRCADYLGMLRDFGYAVREPMAPGKAGVWRATRKAPPADWVEVFPASKRLGDRQRREVIEATPFGAGPCELQLVMGLAVRPVPESVTPRVFMAPREYEAEEMQRQRRAA